jgi:hypothetical protein
MNFKELNDPNLASEFLSSHLVNGTLTLFLGAGATKGFGLPNWTEFANSFRAKCSLSVLGVISKPEDIQDGIDEALDVIKNNEETKISIVKEILYGGKDFLEPRSIYSNKLLIAISSLLMGSRRGHIKRVVTLNYDSMLEWFLSLFGFLVNPISDLPALEGSEDVRIYHPHGFVPHPQLGLPNGKFLILGVKDANNRLGNKSDPWFEKVRQIMESGVCLFVGLSGNTLSDRAIAPLLSTTGDKFVDERPLGIWIHLGDLTPQKKAEYHRNNIVPLEMSDAEEIPDFLLQISQKALGKQISL